jgi:leucyl-tRNA synthetase
MKYLAEIIFGKDQVRKYHNNETLNDCEKIINLKKYTFETWVERNAFYKGIGEAMGWLEFEVIKESEEKNGKEEKEDEDKFDYWSFIEKYYPNYDHCDNILLSDILTRKLVGAEICEEDEENIKDWNVRKELFNLDKELLCDAFENYFNIIYLENPILK